MEYFMSHLVYVVIAGIVLGLVCFLWAMLSERNEKKRNKEQEKWESGDGCFTAEKCKD